MALSSSCASLTRSATANGKLRSGLLRISAKSGCGRTPAFNVGKSGLLGVTKDVSCQVGIAAVM